MDTLEEVLYECDRLKKDVWDLTTNIIPALTKRIETLEKSEPETPVQ